ncbi:MAG: MotA/TolQ/ExbB proton channel family protein [Muribaculaceae bacterium]|jgi:biopolymer transport protein ExbB|nr:MotA/TolQ/ExbB proton channel family protein [Muribaculaceae bacterium]MEE1338528.1 MotA/TolQ/ExbB proton channel family protein [Muribaculaceae bacterium]
MNILTNILASIMPEGDSLAMVTDSLATAAVAETPVVEAELSMWELCLKGGIIMIPLLILSVISIYILVERFIAIRKAAQEDKTFMKRIKDYIHDGEIESAMNLCKKTNTPYSRLILKGITRIGRPMNDVLVAIENVGNLEIAELEKGFTWLATTAAGAPMLGFLGTVTGMVQAFFAMASAGSNANVTVLASGIYEALVTTVAGLFVGIIALFAYNYLVAMVNKVMKQLEAKTMEFLDLLNEPAQ